MVKAFISHSSRNQTEASIVMDTLERLNIETFFSGYEDHIPPSDGWKKKILGELNFVDVFVAVLSREFKDSEFCSQEIGIAVERDIPIVVVSLDGTKPYGFISHLQGKEIKIEHNFLSPLKNLYHPIVNEFPSETIPILVKSLREVRKFSAAAEIMGTLKFNFDKFNQEHIDEFIDNCIYNNQVHSCYDCTDDIRKFIDIHKDNIEENKREQLISYLDEVSD